MTTELSHTHLDTLREWVANLKMVKPVVTASEALPEEAGSLAVTTELPGTLVTVVDQSFVLRGPQESEGQKLGSLGPPPTSKVAVHVLGHRQGHPLRIKHPLFNIFFFQKV